MNLDYSYALQGTKQIFRRLLNRDFVQYRKQRQSDGQGGYKETLVPISTFRGRMSVTGTTASEVRISAKWPAEIDAVLYLEAPFDIVRNDEVESKGQRYRVVAVKEPSLAQHHLEVGCIQLQNEV